MTLPLILLPFCVCKMSINKVLKKNLMTIKLDGMNLVMYGLKK